MSFNIGDRVRIITREFEGNGCAHFGVCGTIVTHNRIVSQAEGPAFLVERDGLTKGSYGYQIWYGENHLELEGGERMVSPEMELEEIHKAQEILDAIEHP